jgi:hypothetical protein
MRDPLRDGKHCQNECEQQDQAGYQQSRPESRALLLKWIG